MFMYDFLFTFNGLGTALDASLASLLGIVGNEYAISG